MRTSPSGATASGSASTSTTEDLFPLEHPMITCGNRLDLPRRQRVHQWVALGTDVRNCAARGFMDVQVYACSLCGRDKFSRGEDEKA